MFNQLFFPGSAKEHLAIRTILAVPENKARLHVLPDGTISITSNAIPQIIRILVDKKINYNHYMEADDDEPNTRYVRFDHETKISDITASKSEVNLSERMSHLLSLLDAGKLSELRIGMLSHIVSTSPLAPEVPEVIKPFKFLVAVSKMNSTQLIDWAKNNTKDCSQMSFDDDVHKLRTVIAKIMFLNEGGFEVDWAPVTDFDKMSNVATTFSARPSFSCIWGEGYAVPSTEENNLEFFGVHNGYEEDQISKISQLKVGESIDLSDPSGEHHVTRIS